MKYIFEVEEEIKACRQCPCHSTDQYGADGCELLNDYLDIKDPYKEIDTRCKLIKS